MGIMQHLLEIIKLPLGGLVLGVIAGMLTGIFGAGGGFFITPALNIFLGLPYNMAVGTSSCQVLAASSMALYHRFDRKMHGVRIALLTGFGIPAGSLLGVKLVEKIGKIGDVTLAGHRLPGQQTVFSMIFIIFLGLIASWLIFDNFYLRRNRTDDDHVGYLAWVKIKPMISCRTIPAGPFSAPVFVLLGVFVGFLGGLLGIGGGVIMMPLLFYVVGQETKYATLTSTMLVFMISLISTVLHASHGNIDYLLFAFLFCGSFLGVKVGIKIHERMGGKSIRKYFAFVVLAAALMVLIKLLISVSRSPVV